MLKIGDQYKGGIVFSIQGDTILIAAPSDQSEGCDWQKAQFLLSNLVIQGYSDWRMPDKEELNTLYTQLAKEDKGEFKNTYYWSSTQNTESGLYWYENFKNGQQSYFTSLKNNHIALRVIRTTHAAQNSVS